MIHHGFVRHNHVLIVFNIVLPLLPVRLRTDKNT